MREDQFDEVVSGLEKWIKLENVCYFFVGNLVVVELSHPNTYP